jgi:chemotaxis protein MotA
MNVIKQIKDTHPPKFVEKFIHWCLPAELKEPMLGDLTEEYMHLAVKQPFKANFWYRSQALRTGLQFIAKTKKGLMMFILSILVFFGVVVMTMIMSGGYR